jgi:hypothetical protein
MSQAQFEASVIRVQSAIKDLWSKAEFLDRAVGQPAEVMAVADELGIQIERIRTSIILLRHDAQLVERPIHVEVLP